MSFRSLPNEQPDPTNKKVSISGITNQLDLSLEGLRSAITQFIKKFAVPKAIANAIWSLFAFAYRGHRMPASEKQKHLRQLDRCVSYLKRTNLQLPSESDNE